MGFYEEIAKYYELIFPMNEKKLSFISNTLQKTDDHILDVACGTGDYSIELAKRGYQVTAIDLDQKMVDITKEKAEKAGENKHIDIETKQMDMLSIDQLDEKFTTIFCIGNSLVHLKDKDEISEFIKKSYELLNPDGYLILQIINFDRVLSNEVTSLPTIYNQGHDLVFKRNYVHKEDNIHFHTILQVQDKRYENTIPLLPIRSNDLYQMIEQYFPNIEIYGDFNEHSFNPKESYHLVIKAKK